MAVAYLQPKDYVAQVAPDSAAYSEAEALAYTRWLATHHYENFQVVSFLLPKHLHQDFYNVYSFCRWADDLGDEIGDCEQSLKLLAWGNCRLCMRETSRIPCLWRYAPRFVNSRFRWIRSTA